MEFFYDFRMKKNRAELLRSGRPTRLRLQSSKRFPDRPTTLIPSRLTDDRESQIGKMNIARDAVKLFFLQVNIFKQLKFISFKNFSYQL